MGNPLRDRRTPQEFAASGQVIDFICKISDLEQLASIIEADLEALNPDKLPAGWRDTDVAGQLRFGFADAQNGLPTLEGEVATTIDAVCQRCLMPLRLPLAVEPRLLFGGAGSPRAADDGYELWELDEETLRPLDIIEESLIMALPLAAVHDDDTCHEPDVVANEVEDKIRPFAALRAQMEKEN